jgi:hypothetical protein
MKERIRAFALVRHQVDLDDRELAEDAHNVRLVGPLGDPTKPENIRAS